MQLDKNTIETIVKEVIDQVKDKTKNSPQIIERSTVQGCGVFRDIKSAIHASLQAQQELMGQKLEVRQRILTAIRETARQNAEEIAAMTVQETGMGRLEDKVKKIHIAADRTPGLEDLVTEAASGDNGLTIVERAPYGVVSSVTPSTHPVPTLVNNSIGLIAGGNSVFFNPHPSSKTVFKHAVRLFNRAVTASGGPDNLITCLDEPTIDSTKESFDHPDVKLIVVTGGPGVVAEAMLHSKRVIGAGPGNPPVVVDETADLKKAARSIVDGGTFDNNIFCTAEKEIFVVESAADRLIQELREYKSHELTLAQAGRLAEQAIADSAGEHPVMNRKLVGRNASILARSIGLDISGETRLLFAETSHDHIFVRAEQLMPFIPLVRVRDVDEAIELALRYEHNFKHTAIMHSLNLSALDRMARLSGVTIFVKNGPSLAGLGVGGQGTTTFTIAGTTGEGITTARTFTRMRRCVLVDHFRIV